jgi:hypothetical protein
MWRHGGLAGAFLFAGLGSKAELFFPRNRHFQHLLGLLVLRYID